MCRTHCKKCGTELAERNKKILEYEQRSGVPVYLIKRICPNKRHWWDGHTKTEALWRNSESHWEPYTY